MLAHTCLALASTIFLPGLPSLDPWHVTRPEDSPEGRRHTLEMNWNAVLSEDDAQAARLGSALERFLAEVRSGAFSAALVDPSELDRFAFYFRGLEGLGRAPEFEPPRVLKSFPTDGESFCITLAFSRHRGGTTSLYKVVEVVATPNGDSYRFSCPFPRNTQDMLTRAVGSVEYHYRGALDAGEAEEFSRFKSSFSELTSTEDAHLDYYVFRTLDELLKAYGFVYDAGKCNFLAHDLGFSDDGGRVFVTGTGDPGYVAEYVRDHLQLRVQGAEELYAPFATGMAVYYGGYFLSGHSLEDLKAQFRRKLELEPAIDFLEEFQKGRKSSVERHFSYFVMSAFVCEQVVERHGVPSALELAHSGPNGERFFEGLDRLLGVDETNFHDSIVSWIGG